MLFDKKARRVGLQTAKPVPSIMAAACVLAIVGQAGAQTIAGHVIDNVTRTPVAGAFVLAMDVQGLEIGRALTTPAGGFQLDGRQRTSVLRVEQAGFGSTDLPIENMSPQVLGSVEIGMRMRPIVLTGVTAGDGSCRVDLDADPGTRLLWREARKALSALAWSERAPRYAYDATEYERSLSADGAIIGETTASVTGGSLAPHLLSEPASGVANADWFLTEEFITSHCFSLERQVGSTQVGIAFANSGDATGETSGTLWLDSATAVLASVTLRVGANADGAATTSRLKFARLDDGGWVVKAWDTTAPVAADDNAAERTVVQTGGMLTAVRVGDLTVLEDLRVTLVTGTVYDSTVGNVLPNAVVALSGTEHWTTTDGSGVFFLAGHLEGKYDIVFGHPRIDSIGFISPAKSLDLELGVTRNVNLGVPPLRSVLASRCPMIALTSLRRVLFGIVRDSEGRPVLGADVAAFWQTIPTDLRSFGVDDQEARGRTGNLGTFTLCGLRVGREVVVRAQAGDMLSEFVPVLFDGESFRAGRDVQTGDRQVARLDFTLRSPAEMEASIQGRVLADASLRPIVGVEIIVAGTPYTAVTDATGYFTIGNLPPGSHRITARRVGYRRVRHDAVLARGETLMLSDDALKMPSGVTELAPIVVEAEGVLLAQRHLVTSGFFDRREAGFGSFATREEIEEWRPTETTDALRHMRGIRVIPNPSYGFGRDRRKYLIGSGRTASLSQGNFCPALIFLDGVFAGNGVEANIDIDNLMSVNNIEAIEVYSGPSETPPRFNRPGANCGVVAIWTR